MKIQRIIRIVFAIALSAMAASCVTTRKVAYLQDMKHGTQIELEDVFEAVILPYDELQVIITTFDTDLARPFNIYGAASGALATGSQYLGYLVDQYGNIELPVLGSIHVAGMTRLQLQEKIHQMLIEGEYLDDPFVMVRFNNFKIFFIGSNGGKAITIDNERCTFLEALALSGDLNVFTDRSKIAVMREIDGKMVTRYLDPRSSKVFDDPFFMLQQNDFIITRDVAYHNFQQSFAQWGTIFSLISSIASVTSILMMLKIIPVPIL